MLQYFILGNLYDDVLHSPQNMFLSPFKITSTPISSKNKNEVTRRLKYDSTPPSSLNKSLISPTPIHSNKKDESKIIDN